MFNNLKTRIHESNAAVPFAMPNIISADLFYNQMITKLRMEVRNVLTKVPVRLSRNVANIPLSVCSVNVTLQTKLACKGSGAHRTDVLVSTVHCIHV